MNKKLVWCALVLILCIFSACSINQSVSERDEEWDHTVETSANIDVDEFDDSNDLYEAVDTIIREDPQYVLAQHRTTRKN